MANPSSIDCPACGQEIPLPVQERCPLCGAWLEAELEEDGLAVVSAQKEPDDQPSLHGNTPGQEDPILEDHARWRTGSIFGMVSGFLGLFVISLISYGDYASYGKAFFRQGNNALFLAISAGFGALLFFGSITLFVLVSRENRKYRQAILRMELAKSQPPAQAL